MLFLFILMSVLAGPGVFAQDAPPTQGLSSLSQELSPSCRHIETAFHCVSYVRNYDADTITVTIPGLPPILGRDIAVRLVGLDAPEIKSRSACEREKARVARDYVQSLLSRATSISLHDVDRDKYFRILADVHVDGRSLNQILLREKLAVPYAGGRKSTVNWCDGP